MRPTIVLKTNMYTIAKNSYQPKPGHILKISGIYGTLIVLVNSVRRGRLSGQVKQILWEETDPDSTTLFLSKGDYVNFTSGDIQAVLRRNEDTDDNESTSSSESTSSLISSDSTDYSVGDEILLNLED